MRKEVICTILIIVGLCLTGFAVSEHIKHSNRLKYWGSVNGEVVDYDESYSDDTIVYAEVVRYVVDGNTYYITSDVSSSFPKMLGEKVMVLYDKSNPNNAIIEGDNLGLIVLPIMSIICIVVGVFGIIKCFKQKQ